MAQAVQSDTYQENNYENLDNKGLFSGDEYLSIVWGDRLPQELLGVGSAAPFVTISEYYLEPDRERENDALRDISGSRNMDTATYILNPEKRT